VNSQSILFVVNWPKYKQRC